MIFQQQYETKFSCLKKIFLMEDVKEGQIQEVSSLLDIGANVDSINTIKDDFVIPVLN